tara:strand:+ start:2207 stop:2938 length:732 start_codon:yes stop_codon:yes gene_type:complete
MALRLLLQRAHISDDGITNELLDFTGDYDAIDKPGGYGTPNNDRNTYGLQMFILEKGSTGEVIIDNVIQQPPSGTPTDVTRWRFNNQTGGYYSYYLCAITNYAGGTTYLEDELVYDPTGMKFYRSVQAANTGNALNLTAWWEDVDALTAVEQLVIFRQAEELADTGDIMEFIADDDAADMITYDIDWKIAELFQVESCLCNSEGQLGEYEMARQDGEGMLIMFGIGSWMSSQAMYEKLYNRLY